MHGDGNGAAGKELSRVYLGIEPGAADTAGDQIRRGRLAAGGLSVARVLTKRGGSGSCGCSPTHVTIGLSDPTSEHHQEQQDHERWRQHRHLDCHRTSLVTTPTERHLWGWGMNLSSGAWATEATVHVIPGTSRGAWPLTRTLTRSGVGLISMVTRVRLPDWARKDLAAASALDAEFPGTWATSIASAAAAPATCLAWNHNPYWTMSMIQNSNAGITTAS